MCEFGAGLGGAGGPRVTTVTAIDWGNVPAWIALLGGGVALLSYLTSRDDARRSAAIGVYFVMDYNNSYGADKLNLSIINSSTMPIHNVLLQSFDGPCKRRKFWRLSGFLMTSTLLEIRHVFAIKPGDSVSQPGIRAVRPGRPAPEMPTAQLVLTFRDGNGRNWVRWHDGRLNRIYRLPEPEQPQWHQRAVA